MELDYINEQQILDIYLLEEYVLLYPVLTRYNMDIYYYKPFLYYW